MVEENKQLEEGQLQRCFELVGKGYSRSQLTNDLGFSERTTDRAIANYRKEYGEIPAQQNSAPKESKFEVMKMQTKEIVPPEQALVGIRLQDGEYKLGFQDGMGVLLMAARYNQILAASQSEILTNQIKVMEESRKGSMDMADEAARKAAAGTGAQVMAKVDELKNQMTASSPNPMMSMFTQAMQPYFGQMLGSVMAAFQPRQQPGQQPGTQPPPQAQPQPGAQPTAGPQATEDEVREAFDE